MEKLAMVSCSLLLMSECIENWLANLLTVWLTGTFSLCLYPSLKNTFFSPIDTVMQSQFSISCDCNTGYETSEVGKACCCELLITTGIWLHRRLVGGTADRLAGWHFLSLSLPKCKNIPFFFCPLTESCKSQFSILTEVEHGQLAPRSLKCRTRFWRERSVFLLLSSCLFTAVRWCGLFIPPCLWPTAAKNPCVK